MQGFRTSTFFDSGLGVPSTLLFIFWAGFIFSMTNSELGAIPGCSGVTRGGYKIKDYQSIKPFYGLTSRPIVVQQPPDRGCLVAFTHQGCCWPCWLPLGMALDLPGSSCRACCSCRGRMESLLPSCLGTCWGSQVA